MKNKLITPTLIIIGENIKNLRKEQELSQEKLAELANLHRTFLGSIERGERNISIATLSKIATALKTPLENLIIDSKNFKINNNQNP